jgi:hypothetical protein
MRTCRARELGRLHGAGAIAAGIAGQITEIRSVKASIKNKIDRIIRQKSLTRHQEVFIRTNGSNRGLNRWHSSDSMDSS